MLTEFEKLIIESAEYLESLKVDYFLIGSTLLGSFREKRALVGDKEVNFGILWEDRTPALIKQIKKDYKFYHEKADGTFTFFSHDWEIDKPITPYNMWEIETGFTLLSGFKLYKDIRYESFNDRALIYPAELLNDKKQWGEIGFLGRKFKTPRNPLEWLLFYYGPNWIHRDENWTWFTNASNNILLSELDKVVWHYKFIIS